MNTVQKLISAKRQKGQVSIEALVVILIWVLVCFFFLSVMFLIASLMLNQTVLNRTAQQIAALGCVPNGIVADGADNTLPVVGIGTTGVEDVQVVQANPTSPDVSTAAPVCGNNPDNITDAGGGQIDPVAGSQIVEITATYNQRFFAFLGDLRITRSATAASGRLEGTQ